MRGLEDETGARLAGVSFASDRGAAGPGDAPDYGRSSSPPALETASEEEPSNGGDAAAPTAKSRLTTTRKRGPLAALRQLVSRNAKSA